VPLRSTAAGATTLLVIAGFITYDETMRSMSLFPQEVYSSLALALQAIKVDLPEGVPSTL
jgi:hypothetical protein